MEDEVINYGSNNGIPLSPCEDNWLAANIISTAYNNQLKIEQRRTKKEKLLKNNNNNKTHSTGKKPNSNGKNLDKDAAYGEDISNKNEVGKNKNTNKHSTGKKATVKLRRSKRYK